MFLGFQVAGTPRPDVWDNLGTSYGANVDLRRVLRLLVPTDIRESIHMLSVSADTRSPIRSAPQTLELENFAAVSIGHQTDRTHVDSVGMVRENQPNPSGSL